MNKILRPHISKGGLVWGAMLIIELLAFEIYNFLTTQYALQDIIGNLKFLGVAWATTLAVAFCGIDFVSISCMFTTRSGQGVPKKILYLFGAWLLVSLLNTGLVYWGIRTAIQDRATLNSPVLNNPGLLFGSPFMLAALFYLIRILVIGALSVSGDRIFADSNPGVKPKMPARRYPPEIPGHPFNNAANHPPKVNPPQKKP